MADNKSWKFLPDRGRCTDACARLHTSYVNDIIMQTSHNITFLNKTKTRTTTILCTRMSHN